MATTDHRCASLGFQQGRPDLKARAVVADSPYRLRQARQPSAYRWLFEAELELIDRELQAELRPNRATR